MENDEGKRNDLGLENRLVVKTDLDVIRVNCVR
jgi:hypothetical protein